MVQYNHAGRRGWAWLCSSLLLWHSKCSHGQSVPLEAMEALVLVHVVREPCCAWEAGGSHCDMHNASPLS